MPRFSKGFTPLKLTRIAQYGDVLCSPEAHPLSALTRWRFCMDPYKVMGLERICFMMDGFAGQPFSEIAKSVRRTCGDKWKVRAYRPNKKILALYRKLAQERGEDEDDGEDEMPIRLTPNAFHSKPHPFFVRDAKVKPAPYRKPKRIKKKRK